jgi:hypothetical protein
MKKLMVPVACVLVGCAAGVAMPAITAKTFSTPANVTPVQVFCETFRTMSAVSEAAQRYGAQGFHVTAMYNGAMCFERPAQ